MGSNGSSADFVSDFLADAGRLLAIPSTADRPEELRRALDFVLGYVLDPAPGPPDGPKDHPAHPAYTVERFESGGKPSALVYLGTTRPHFRIILNGHLDVVPALPEQFRPRRDGDRLYARGAQDMKVSALMLARVFRELAASLPYPIGLQLVTDEEVGGRDGTAHQLALGVAGDFVVIGEFSGLDVVTESKGVITATLRAVGRSAHSAYQWFGDNALLKLQRSLDKVLAAYPVPTEEIWRTTVNVARIETHNPARNQVPALAEAHLDIRFPPEDTDFDGRTIEEITAHLAGFCEPGVTPTIDFTGPPHHADSGRPEVERLRRAARGQGHRSDLLRKHGAADGRYYYQRGIDAVLFGVGGGGLHGPDEYLDIGTVAPYYLALREFLRDPGRREDR